MSSTYSAISTPYHLRVLRTHKGRGSPRGLGFAPRLRTLPMRALPSTRQDYAVLHLPAPPALKGARSREDSLLCCLRLIRVTASRGKGVVFFLPQAQHRKNLHPASMPP